MMKSAIAAALTALMVGPISAADTPWVGTWKLDPSKSHMTGETITFSQAQNGKLRFSDDSTFSDEFAIDGKEYRSAFGRTTTWKAAGERAWDSETKMGGLTVTKKHFELSADEKMLMVTTTGINPNGTPFRIVAKFDRIGSGKGLLGRWRTTSLDISPLDLLVLSSPAPGVLRWLYVAEKQTFEGKPDGRPYPVNGPTVPKTLTMSFKIKSPAVLSYTYRTGGKPETYGLQTLASDRQSFTDAYWHPGKKSETVTEFYVRQ